MRIVFIQHGDYREAAERFAAGEAETYYAQRYSVDIVSDLAKEAEQVTVICLAIDPYETVTDTGVRTLGMQIEQDGPAALIRKLDAERPTHVVLRSPVIPVIRWCRDHNVRVFPILADSFRDDGLRARFRYWKLARTLNLPELDWVANHNLNASNDLARIGVAPGKIVPWDWPNTYSPEDFEVKAPVNGSCNLIYAGHMSEPKGVGDLINAVHRLRERGVPATLTLVGGGKSDQFRDRVKTLKLEQHVTFTGRIPHREVIEQMRAHDAVVVASRHEYPEGLPNTLFDALVSRTPLVVSDHPMFVTKIVDGESGVVFRASSPKSLAETVQRLISTPELYTKLSENAVETARTFRCRAMWGDVINHWLKNGDEDRAWLAEHALPAYAVNDNS